MMMEHKSRDVNLERWWSVVGGRDVGVIAKSRRHWSQSTCHASPLRLSF